MKHCIIIIIIEINVRTFTILVDAPGILRGFSIFHVWKIKILLV